MKTAVFLAWHIYTVIKFKYVIIFIIKYGIKISQKRNKNAKSLQNIMSVRGNELKTFTYPESVSHNEYKQNEFVKQQMEYT